MASVPNAYHSQRRQAFAWAPSADARPVVSPHHRGKIVPVAWHFGTLPRATKRALDALAGQPWLRASSWYLAGGTALALHVGHRRSLDLDFFTTKHTFNEQQLIERFLITDWTTDILREGTVYGRFLGAKVSFIAYPFFVPSTVACRYGAVRILVPEDIAVMKIIAISQRGRKRDFVDLYWYATHRESLVTVIRHLSEQYPKVAHDYHHIIKSLTYFVDAEEDEMPACSFRMNWRTIKEYFRREVPKVARELLRLR